MTASCKAALTAHLRKAQGKVGDIHLLGNFFL